MTLCRLTGIYRVLQGLITGLKHVGCPTAERHHAAWAFRTKPAQIQNYIGNLS